MATIRAADPTVIVVELPDAANEGAFVRSRPALVSALGSARNSRLVRQAFG
jgi:hypothetical protein